MCRNCEPFGGKWKETETGLKRCDCPQGQELRRSDDIRKNPQRLPPVLSARDTEVFVEMLATVPFFPPESGGRLLVAEEVRSMCRNAGEAMWLCQRICQLYSRWPGVREMRLVYCAKSIPLDGLLLVGTSEVYPNGIPSESHHEPLAITAGSMRALPEGHTSTADADLDRKVRLLAHSKDMSFRPKKPAPAPTNPNYKPITDVDVARAVEDLHDKRARGEVGL